MWTPLTLYLRGSTTTTPSYSRLRQYAIAISIISVIYNCAEGGVSIGFGYESSSRSLIFFGIQSGIEVASSALVLWRFCAAKPGEDESRVLGTRELRMEKIISGTIGGLLLMLGVGTEVSAVVGLALHQEPDASNASTIVSAGALIFMIIIWLPKRYLARALNSSAMQGEATCSLSCIQITIVLFIGSLVFRLWRGGWWVDSATSLLLGILFGWEGLKMVRWVCNPEFDGGCCGHSHCRPKKIATLPDGAAELGEQYRDLCERCSQNIECKESEECKCEVLPSDVSLGHYDSTTVNRTKCCTRRIVQVSRPDMHVDPCCDGDGSLACSKGADCERAMERNSCNGRHIGGACGQYLRRMAVRISSLLL